MTTTTLRQHDRDATLAPEPGWRERIATMESDFKIAGVVGLQLVVAVIARDEEKAVRLARVAGDLAIQGFRSSSCGWETTRNSSDRG